MSPAVKSPGMIRLTLRQGSIVQTFALPGEKAFVGRLDANDVAVDDPAVSRKHCMIRVAADGGLEVLDLNSRHGTVVNGRSVERSPLVEGDEIWLGEARLRVGYPGLAPSSAAPAPPPSSPGPPARAKKDLISAEYEITFSQRLYRHLGRTPFWAASLLLHVVVVYVFCLFPFPEPAPEDGIGTLAGTLDDDLSSFVENLPGPDDSAFADALEPEPVFPDLDDAMEDPADEPAPYTDEETADILKIGPSQSDFSAREKAVDLASAVEVPDAAFGQGSADEANRRAAALLRRSFRSGEGGPLGILRRLSPGEVVVVEGQYDRVEEFLDLLDVSYEKVFVRAIERTRFEGRRVVFVNCGNEAPSAAGVKRLREFVERGGYLLGSDWAVENVMRRGFSEFVVPLEHRGRNVITPNEVIAIHAGEGGLGHFLLEGTALGRRDARWWLEESSYPFRIVNPSAVTSLIESNDLEREYGTSPVAATFRCGQGRVLHMLGHFWQKEGNLKGAFSAQRLIANFLISALRKR